MSTRTFEARDRIEIIDGGFRVSAKTGAWEIAFAAIERVDAYKRDQIATDLLCFDIWSGGQAFWVSEDVEGFDALDAALADALVGFDAQWRHQVVLPPFAENRTTIFLKGSDA